MGFKPILFLFLFILGYYYLLFLLKGNPILPTVSNLLLTIASLITVIVLQKAFKNQYISNKNFTLLLLLGCIFYSLGNGYWTYYEYVNGTVPNIGLYDFLMLIVHICFLWALIQYFKTHKVFLATTYIFDILIFTVITTTLAWVFIIRPLLIPTYDAYSLLTLVTYLAYPIADLIILFACFMILLCTSLTKSIVFIILGFFITIIANSVNFYEILNTVYIFGHLIDPLWSLAILIIGFSGLDKFEVNKANNQNYSKKYFQLFIPYSIMIIFLFVVYINFYDIKDPLLIGVFISIVLLTIRLFHTINRNEALNNEIHKKNLQLRDVNDQLKFLAFHEELTQLPNRHYLFNKMQDAMDKYNSKNLCHFYLLFIDLDGFKSVNDTFGHTTGDTLLKQVSNRLKEQISETDGDFLCRFAGDEFIILFLIKIKTMWKIWRLL